MSQPLFVGVALVGGLLLLAALVWWGTVQRRRRVVDRLQRGAMQRGWVSVPHWQSAPQQQPLYHFSGNSGGVGWVLHGDRGSGGTHWHTSDAHLPAGMLVVLPHLPDWLSGMVTSGDVLGQALHHVSPTAPFQAVDASLMLVDAGSDLLREHYTILSTSEATAAQVLAASEAALLNQALAVPPTLPAAALVVLFSANGVEVHHQQTLNDPAALDALVQLGSALAAELRQLYERDDLSGSDLEA